MPIFLTLSRFIFGYVRFIIGAANSGRLLGLLTANRVPYWGARRLEDGRLLLFVPYRRRKYADYLAGRAEAEILERRETGLPTVFKRYHLRVGLALGMLLAGGMLFGATRFVWEIDIVQDSGLPHWEIMNALRGAGLRIGSRVGGIDAQRVEKACVTSDGNIAWAAVNLDGTCAHIEVLARTAPPDVIGRYDPVNIVAARTGNIVTIDVQQGLRVVKRGDGVTKGQLLVSGVIDSRVVGYRPVHASANVMAQTSREFDFYIPVTQTQTVSTGKTAVQYKFGLQTAQVALYLRPYGGFAAYSRTQSEQQVVLFGAIRLPLYIVKYTYSESEQQQSEIDAGAAYQLAAASLARAVNGPGGLSQQGALVQSAEYSQTLEDGQYVVRFYLTCLENIASEVRVTMSDIGDSSQYFPGVKPPR